jgi:hypothetical protein
MSDCGQQKVPPSNHGDTVAVHADGLLDISEVAERCGVRVRFTSVASWRSAGFRTSSSGICCDSSRSRSPSG